MPSMLGAGSLPFIACVALLVAAILQILGFAVPSWSFNALESRYEGLWRYGACLQELYQDCYKYDHKSFGYVEAWLHIVRGLESLGIIFMSVPLVVLPVYIYVALGMYYRCMLGTMCFSTLLSAVSIIVGVIIYAIKITEMDNWSIEWCLIVCVVAAGITFIAFLLLLIAACSRRPESLKAVYAPTQIYVDPHKNKLYTIRLDEEY